MRRKGKIICIVGLLMFFYGCASFSNFQTAETLGEGASSIGVGFTSTTITPEPDVKDIYYEDVTYFTPELSFRHGVAEHFDLGAKVYFSYPVFGLIGEGKYQFIDGTTFDAAVDLGVGYTGVEINDNRTTYLDLYPALLMTVHAGESFSATLAPKVVVRVISSDAGDETETIPGATFTLAIGKKFKVMPEVGYYKSDKAEFIHYGLGLSWNF